MTHTYVLMEVSDEVYAEVERKLRDAGYDHAIDDGELDMHGIALVKESENGD